MKNHNYIDKTRSSFLSTTGSILPGKTLEHS